MFLRSKVFAAFANIFLPVVSHLGKDCFFASENSTLVTIKGHLLAVGGESTQGDSTTDVYQYNSRDALWQVVSQMSIPRSRCAAALLQNNNLMVVAGAPLKKEYVTRKYILKPTELAIVH